MFLISDLAINWNELILTNTTGIIIRVILFFILLGIFIYAMVGASDGDFDFGIYLLIFYTFIIGVISLFAPVLWVDTILWTVIIMTWILVPVFSYEKISVTRYTIKYPDIFIKGKK